MTRRDMLALGALGLFAGPMAGAAAAAPQGQLTWAAHVSLAPTWFDPAETSGIITPYMVLYALHDALVKPMPGKSLAPSLAEFWTAGRRRAHLRLRAASGAKFHNGEPVTAEDVKFSFERYRGANGAMIKARVAAIETPDPRHVHFKLKEPWPDFLTFYGSATGAGWVVPRKYLEQVGDDGFKKAPIGAGPYKFVGFKPGIELTMEAFEGYWRKQPSIKRIVLRSVPDELTRLAQLKTGEVDGIYWITGQLAEDLQRTPGLTLSVSQRHRNGYISPSSGTPNRPGTTCGYGRPPISGSTARTSTRRSSWARPAARQRLCTRAFRVLPEGAAAAVRPGQSEATAGGAGHPNGLDAGPLYCDAAFSNIGEALVNSLREVGIRANLRPIERAGFYKSFSEKKLNGLIMGGSAAFGNAATRMEAFAVKGGVYAYGSYPDIDALFQKQAVELDHAKREAVLFQMQQLVQEKVIAASIWQLAALSGVGPRVGESTLGTMGGYPWTSPYEDVTLKSA